MIPNIGVFVFLRNFAIRQIWRCPFQVSQYHFQIPAKKYSNKGFLVLNLGIFFFFSRNFEIRQIRGSWFQIWQYMFQLPVLKYPNQAFLVQKFKDFYFCTKLCNKTNSRTLISNMTIIFSNSIPKIQKSDKEILLFARNFTTRQIRGCWFQIWQWLFKIPAQNT